jgi:mannitol-1-/sugar-/sorbitol-6-/2-deoxyglucose-6-phosphatase
MIKAVIYDMDGILIDSEPLWRRAEIGVFRQVDVHLSEDMCRQTTGLRMDEVVEYWYRRFPWRGASKKQIEERIYTEVIRLVKEEGVTKEGVYASLVFMRGQQVKVALASTSDMALIHAVLEKLCLKDFFDVIHSAEFEVYGKPHPAVYLSTASLLGVEASACLAIEDSINGMIAAKAAQMKLIAIPDPLLAGDKRLGIADVVLSSLLAIDQELWRCLEGSAPE